MKMQIKNLIAVVLVATIVGCAAASRKAGFEDVGSNASQSSLSSAERAQMDTQAKKLWSTRQNQKDLEAALEIWKKMVEAGSASYDVLTSLTRGHYLLADGHLQDMEQKKAMWEKSVYWGERALATNDDFRKNVVEEKKPVADSLGALTVAQIDALYWTAASLGKWAKNSGIGTTLKYKSQIRQMIERVSQLKPDYFYGAVHRYWAVYYAVAPGFAGGSMDKSDENFKKAFKTENNYLGTHVLYAENYATRKSDREAFKRELQFVLDAKPEALLKDIIPEQLLEQKKAKQMLENLESFF